MVFKIHPSKFKIICNKYRNIGNQVGAIQPGGGGDRRGRKKTISDPNDFRVPRGASDPLEWGMLESSDHEVGGAISS